MAVLSANSLAVVLKLATYALISKIVVGVWLSYRRYLPPDFEYGFLQGREDYFFGGYDWAFYVHIVTGPVSLILGMILLSHRFRLRFSKWHRRLGRIQVANVLLFLTPSGLWMSFYSATGDMAGTGFAALAVANSVTAALGWRAAVRRRFAAHQVWMLRTFVLLCSAVVLRVIAGLATVTQFDSEWVYPLSAWASWIVPLLAYEAWRTTGNRVRGV